MNSRMTFHFIQATRFQFVSEITNLSNQAEGNVHLPNTAYKVFNFKIALSSGVCVPIALI